MRLVAALVVLFVMWLVPYSSALAAPDFGTYPTRGAALAACEARRADFVAMNSYPWRVYVCKQEPGRSWYRVYYNPLEWSSDPDSVASGTFVWVAECSTPGEVWDDPLHGCKEPCSARSGSTGTPPFSTGGGTGPSMFVMCSDGCVTLATNNFDGTYAYSPQNIDCAITVDPETCGALGFTDRHEGGLWCNPPPEECTSGQTRDPVTGQCKQSCAAGTSLDAVTGTCKPEKDTCPAGQIKSPEGTCLPGENQCAAGEARGADGTCKKDTDNDGEPDPDNPEEKSFSGGDDCNSPPSCSGDAILCGQARIQWRIDCNTRKDRNISGGTCGSIPICTGKNCDALEYAQLLQTWRTACAVEKLANQTGTGQGDPNGDLAAIRAALTGSSQGDAGDAGNPASSWSSGSGEGTGPDSSGYGWARTCPASPTFTVFDRTYTIDISPACDWIALGGLIAVGLTALGCLRILGQGVG